LDAPSPDAVLAQLRGRGLTPIRVDASAIGTNKAAPTVLGRRQRVARGPVRASDVRSLTSELAIMLRAGLALDNALRVLIDMSVKPSLKALLEGLLEAVKGGAPFSKALLAHQNLFGDFYISMIRSGEASGQMPQVLERLTAHLERLRELRERVITALLYPCILLFVAALSLVVMLGFVVPQFEQLFKDMGDALPVPTRIVMMFGIGFRHYGLYIGIAVIALGYLAWRYLSSPAGRLWLQARLMNMPILGRLMYQYQLTLFSRALGTLLDNGVPMLTALHIATETVGGVALRTALSTMAPMVKEGARMVQAMQHTQAFEPLAINLVRVGEETGRIGPMMKELADVLDRDVENGIKRSLTLLEPIMILVLGLMVAGIIVSILLGILSINDLAK
jgi:general secretion pathway protein F